MKIDTLVLGPVQTNCYIVYNEGAKEAVIIDPAAEPEKIQEALDGKRAAAILLTHGHFDHTGALEAFKGTPIYIHPSDDVMLSDPVWSAGAMFRDKAPRPAATDYVREGMKLHLAELDITVMHTPGHTLGSVVYAIGDTLFTGDTLFCGGYGRTDLMGGDVDEIARSIMRLLREEKDWIICPGHGSLSTLNEEKARYI
ncbi:MAG: MBL fold metallo-hydrolase [Clostridia bacterium]|nr:MBL fold metallo-hydrolase [Clostridia bacterium]